MLTFAKTTDAPATPVQNDTSMQALSNEQAELDRQIPGLFNKIVKAYHALMQQVGSQAQQSILGMDSAAGATGSAQTVPPALERIVELAKQLLVTLDDAKDAIVNPEQISRYASATASYALLAKVLGDIGQKQLTLSYASRRIKTLQQAKRVSVSIEGLIEHVCERLANFDFSLLSVKQQSVIIAESWHLFVKLGPQARHPLKQKLPLFCLALAKESHYMQLALDFASLMATHTQLRQDALPVACSLYVQAGEKLKKIENIREIIALLNVAATIYSLKMASATASATTAKKKGGAAKPVAGSPIDRVFCDLLETFTLADLVKQVTRLSVDKLAEMSDEDEWYILARAEPLKGKLITALTKLNTCLLQGLMSLGHQANWSGRAIPVPLAVDNSAQGTPQQRAASDLQPLLMQLLDVELLFRDHHIKTVRAAPRHANKSRLLTRLSRQRERVAVAKQRCAELTPAANFAVQVGAEAASHQAMADALIAEEQALKAAQEEKRRAAQATREQKRAATLKRQQAKRRQREQARQRQAQQAPKRQPQSTAVTSDTEVELITAPAKAAAPTTPASAAAAALLAPEAASSAAGAVAAHADTPSAPQHPPALIPSMPEPARVFEQLHAQKQAAERALKAHVVANPITIHCPVSDTLDQQWQTLRGYIPNCKGLRVYGGFIRDGGDSRDIDMRALIPDGADYRTAFKVADFLNTETTPDGVPAFIQFIPERPGLLKLTLGGIDYDITLAAASEESAAVYRACDITCNALVLNVDSGEITDPTGLGAYDLANRIARVCRFEHVAQNNSVVLLRLLRFSVTRKLNIAPIDAQLLPYYANQLWQAPAMSILKEIEKQLCRGYASANVKQLHTYGFSGPLFGAPAILFVGNGLAENTANTLAVLDQYYHAGRKLHLAEALLLVYQGVFDSYFDYYNSDSAYSVTKLTRALNEAAARLAALPLLRACRQCDWLLQQCRRVTLKRLFYADYLQRMVYWSRDSGEAIDLTRDSLKGCNYQAVFDAVKQKTQTAVAHLYRYEGISVADQTLMLDYFEQLASRDDYRALCQFYQLLVRAPTSHAMITTTTTTTTTAAPCTAPAAVQGAALAHTVGYVNGSIMRLYGVFSYDNSARCVAWGYAATPGVTQPIFLPAQRTVPY